MKKRQYRSNQGRTPKQEHTSIMMFKTGIILLIILTLFISNGK